MHCLFLRALAPERDAAQTRKTTPMDAGIRAVTLAIPEPKQKPTPVAIRASRSS